MCERAMNSATAVCHCCYCCRWWWWWFFSHCTALPFICRPLERYILCRNTHERARVRAYKHEIYFEYSQWLCVVLGIIPEAIQTNIISSWFRFIFGITYGICTSAGAEAIDKLAGERALRTGRIGSSWVNCWWANWGETRKTSRFYSWKSILNMLEIQFCYSVCCSVFIAVGLVRAIPSNWPCHFHWTIASNNPQTSPSLRSFPTYPNNIPFGCCLADNKNGYTDGPFAAPLQFPLQLILRVSSVYPMEWTEKKMNECIGTCSFKLLLFCPLVSTWTMCICHSQCIVVPISVQRAVGAHTENVLGQLYALTMIIILFSQQLDWIMCMHNWRIGHA